MHPKICLLFALAITLLACNRSNPHTKTSSTKIFDGKTFAGWEGDKSFFRIEDGAIVAGALDRDIPTNQFLCTEMRYEDFELDLKVKFNSTRNNAGIQIRTERIPNNHEVIGYQADVGFVGEDPVWGSLYDESRRNKFLKEADKALVLSTIKKEEYNDYNIRCQGDQIVLSINGTELLHYTEPDKSLPTIGKICVQIHGGHPAEAWYTDLRIKPARRR